MTPLGATILAGKQRQGASAGTRRAGKSPDPSAQRGSGDDPNPEPEPEPEALHVEERPLLRIVNVPAAVPMSSNRMAPTVPAKPAACPTCVFRVANRDVKTDRPSWDKFYRAEVHAKAWAGEIDPEHTNSAMGRGGCNHCHVRHSEACAGMTVVQHRELLRYAAEGPREYFQRPYGLSAEGINVVAERLFGRKLNMSVTQVSRSALLRLVHPAVADPALGMHLLDPPAPGEFDAPDLGAEYGGAQKGLRLSEVPADDGRLFEVLNDGQAIGFAFFTEKGGGGDKTVRVGFGFRKPWRGKGLGRDLINLVTSEALRTYERVTVGVWVEGDGNRAAVHLLEDAGYRRTKLLGLRSHAVGLEMERGRWRGGAWSDPDPPSQDARDARGSTAGTAGGIRLEPVKPGADSFVLMRDGRAIGSAYIKTRRSQTGRYGHVGFTLLPAYRGKGYGRDVIRLVTTAALERHDRVMVATLAIGQGSTPASVHLLETLGFTHCSEFTSRATALEMTRDRWRSR